MNKILNFANNNIKNNYSPSFKHPEKLKSFKNYNINNLNQNLLVKNNQTTFKNEKILINSNQSTLKEENIIVNDNQTTFKGENKTEKISKIKTEKISKIKTEKISKIFFYFFSKK